MRRADAPPTSRRRRTQAQPRAGPQVSGVWDARHVARRSTKAIAAGDMRIEKQEWHLSQAGSAIRGYYIAALTFVSGDGRPYVCSRSRSSRRCSASTSRASVRGGRDRDSRSGQRRRDSEPCDPGSAPLARYSGRLDGDVLTLVSGGSARRSTASTSRTHGECRPGASRPSDDDARRRARPQPDGAPARGRASRRCRRARRRDRRRQRAVGLGAPGQRPRRRPEAGARGVARQAERLEDLRLLRSDRPPGVDRRPRLPLQHGARVPDRDALPVQRRRQRRRDAHLSRAPSRSCRPSACDNGKRRLDVYQGQASTDEIRLVWGMGGQILRRPRPDVPTQRF